MGKGNLGNKIYGRLYLRISGVLDAPLLCGSGEEIESDSDVILDSCGNPFLPGGSLAGVMRSYLNFKTENDTIKKRELMNLFGADREEIMMGTILDPVMQERQSRLYVYDTPLVNSLLILRDGVRLNEKKTAVESAKYQYQAIERGAGFAIRLEIIQREHDILKESGNSLEEKLAKAQERDIQNIEICIAGMIRGELRVGAKTRRGFGSLAVKRVEVKAFHMIDHDDYKDWLNWDWENPQAFTGKKFHQITEDNLSSQILKNRKIAEHHFVIPLKIDGTLLIREYGGKSLINGGIPDSETLKIKGTEVSKAIVPGSTWAGVFRSRIASLMMKISEMDNWEQAQSQLDAIFGTWNMKDITPILPSRLIFEETVVCGGHDLPITRNSIDRFTGGTVEGALFTECVWTGGSVEAKVRIPDLPQEEVKPWIGMLLWVAKDLQNGLLSVGGEGSVGRGLFSRNGDILFDGAVLENHDEYQKAAIRWCKAAVKGES